MQAIHTKRNVKKWCKNVKNDMTPGLDGERIHDDDDIWRNVFEETQWTLGVSMCVCVCVCVCVLSHTHTHGDANMSRHLAGPKVTLAVTDQSGPAEQTSSPRLHCDAIIFHWGKEKSYWFSPSRPAPFFALFPSSTRFGRARMNRPRGRKVAKSGAGDVFIIIDVDNTISCYLVLLSNIVVSKKMQTSRMNSRTEDPLFPSISHL